MPKKKTKKLPKMNTGARIVVSPRMAGPIRLVSRGGKPGKTLISRGGKKTLISGGKKTLISGGKKTLISGGKKTLVTRGKKLMTRAKKTK